MAKDILLAQAEEEGIDLRALEGAEARGQFARRIAARDARRRRSDTGSHLPAEEQHKSASDKGDDKAGTA